MASHPNGRNYPRLRTMPRPKWPRQIRLTITRLVSGLSFWVIHCAN